jgi:lipoyl(octanoyl) transferase
MRVRQLGRADYQGTWQAMRAFTAARDAGTADELWVVEHDPVYTLGLAGRREHLHQPGSIPVVQSDRGGQVTYHGPGQLVVYTLVDLRRAGYFVRELVFRIEESVIQTLDAVGVEAGRVAGAPGIYVPLPAGIASGIVSDFASENSPAGAAQTDPRFAGRAKIAALGIKVQRGCSFHGVALNVAMDLAPFLAIDPCGYRGLRAVDLATLGVQVDMPALAGRLIERLQAHLAPAHEKTSASERLLR